VPRENKNNVIHIKLDPEVYSALTDVAAAEERQPNRQAALYIKTGLEAHAKKLAGA
jgi:hypothetical protein